MKNAYKYVVLGLALMVGLVSKAVAAAPAEITTAITDANTVWGTIKDFKIEIFVFSVLLFIAYKIRGK